MGALAALFVEIELEALINLITVAVGAMSTAINAVVNIMRAWKSIIDAVKDALAGLELPDWLNVLP